MFTTAKQIHAGGHELQDRAEVFWSGANLVLVVADGAGGRSGAAQAAEFVIRRVRQAIHSADLSPAGLAEFLRLTDRQMAEARNVGETTCVIVVISQTGIVGASIGDSGAWHITQAGIDNLTGHQTRKPFLGVGCAIPFGFVRGPLTGTLLVASDGLLKYSSAERIAAVALSDNVETSAQKLVGLVRYPSGALPDDVSVLLARRV
ncbi:MAG: protein phosphatase 2C domain-containing protein [Verrucomicrobiae bacterium]|nr:protein phosphatase 2C domain-containing protein [Verrucomicrobiae bacterium]